MMMMIVSLNEKELYQKLYQKLEGELYFRSFVSVVTV